MVDYTRTLSEIILVSDAITTGSKYNTHTLYDDHKTYDFGRTEQVVYNTHTFYDNDKPYNFYLAQGTNINTQIDWNRVEAESIVLQDTVSNALHVVITLSETISVADSFSYVLTRLISVILNEIITIADTQQKQSILHRALNDSLTVSDVLTLFTSKSIIINDSIGVSDTSTRQFVMSRIENESVNISDYIELVYTNAVDGSPAPTVDGFILKPLPYTEPERMVVYQFIPETTTAISQGITDVVFVNKIYDSHTVYDKHIPYYSAVSADTAPTVLSISEW